MSQVDLILLAQAKIQDAALDFDATSAESIQMRLSRLEAAASLLGNAQNLPFVLSESVITQLRTGLLDIKRNVTLMERIAGASLAFLRGLPGAEQSVAGYGADGAVSGYVSTGAAGVEA